MSGLTGRRLTHEHMDDPQASRGELAEALRYVRWVNRRLGGTAAAVQQLQQWSQDWERAEVIRILDVGTGSGDIPIAIAKWAKRGGYKVEVVGVDLHPFTAALAREQVGGRSEITIVEGDALKLMDQFQAESFDYAHAGMFLHHLDDVGVVTMLRIMDRLARRGMIWNDLVRGWVGRIGSRVLTWGTPQMVRHDARVSVAAGFTKREAIDLARRAGWRAIRYRRRLVYRFVLTSAK